MQKTNQINEKGHKNKQEILSFIIDLMKDELSFSEIKKKVQQRFGIDEAKSEEFVRTAFETISFLEKNTRLTISEKIKVLIGGHIIVIIAAIFYILAAVKVGYHITFMFVVFAYLMSYIIYLLSNRKTGLLLEIISGLYVMFSYLLGEFILFFYNIISEFKRRGIPLTNKIELLFNSSFLFFTDYLPSKTLYEIIIVCCAILIASSFFFRIRIKRIRR